MKSPHFLIVCLFSLSAIYAEAPALEESPLQQQNVFLEGLSFLSEENPLSQPQEEVVSLEEKLNLEEPLENNTQVEQEKNILPSLALDVAEPAKDLEEHVEMIEEKMAPVAQPEPELKNAPDVLATENPAPALPLIEGDAPDVLAIENPAPALPLVEGDAPDVLAIENPAPALPLVEGDTPAFLDIESSSSDINQGADIELDLKRAFSGSPLIYTLLCGMSVFCVFIWLYSLLALRKTTNISHQLLSDLQASLNGNHFDEALSLCRSTDALLCKMIASGIQSRKYGSTAMIESMKAEGKRSSVDFWQKIGLLNDVAIVAPMLGLLGTVLGMFYAFYDVNRSMESITSLFDGLGISVGTTVAGLIVAILALILHSTAKYRLIRALSHVESEAHRVTALIDNHTSLSK